MKIGNTTYTFQEVSSVLTVPDCFVLGPNKLGRGHGEGKFYFGSKRELNSFSIGMTTMECFFLKADLLTYMNAVQTEYQHPTQNYAGRSKMGLLWNKRVQEISLLPDIIEFTVDVQGQIEGPRGYLNSKSSAYKLFRKLSLPLISYISIMRLKRPNGTPVFYWRLFVDFDAMAQKGTTPQVFTYGKGGSLVKHKTDEKASEKQTSEKKEDSAKTSGRDAAAQAKYRAKLLEECPYCPITKISDERLLVASHIKPCAVSSETEAFDPKNGFTLSPLYDRLFDQGFISFDEKKHMMVSNWISPSNQVRCCIKSGTYIQALPLDNDREHYLQYHRQFVFKG